MENFKRLQHLLILWMFYIDYPGYNAQSPLNLYEGDICRSGKKKSLDHICRKISDCPVALQQLRKNNFPRICSFNKNDQKNPIICCPTVETFSATEKCHEYSDLIYSKKRNPALKANGYNTFIKVKNCTDVKPLIVGGKKAESREFPHMALLGYHEKFETPIWACGGSLISDRWILTAAHCEFLNNNPARWARLGQLNFELPSRDNKDYEIIERVLHPNYRRHSHYTDIALFRLERNVNFSPYVRPICLHTEKLIPSSKVLATGWGRIDSGYPLSADLLKVVLDIEPFKKCSASFPANAKISNGIDEESMVCAGTSTGRKDTCSGDSGGPIQIPHPNKTYSCMYSQVGITSFGKLVCGDLGDSIAVYTKVSPYISWIELIVWPKTN